jgi:hypothetical protein
VAQNNQVKQVAYDNASALTRQAAQLAINAAGSGSTSGKFVAWTKMLVFGVTFVTVAAGTSTYTVAGTATNPATQMSALYVSNTNTTGTAVGLATNTVGPFTIGGTSTTGTNVSVGGTSGGIAGGFQGPYALNTLGGTNTTQAWGTQTFTASLVSPPGAPGLGLGGLPMNEGDSITFVMGTDATATIIPILQVCIAPVIGNIVA